MSDEIERIQATLEDIHMKRQQDQDQLLSQHIDQYHALTSPTQQLLQEILLEILVHCLPKDHNTFMSLHEAPLLLGRICSSWRATSPSAPQLWTTIHVTVPDPAYMHLKQEIMMAEHIISPTHMVRLQTAALQEWLNRSGSLPVDTPCNQRARADRANTAQPIVDVILSVAQRWRNITVKAPADIMMSFVTHPPHNLPSLNILRVLESLFNGYHAAAVRFKDSTIGVQHLQSTLTSKAIFGGIPRQPPPASCVLGASYRSQVRISIGVH